MVIDVLLFMFHGLIGAFLSVLFWSKSYRDLVSFNAVVSYITGVIAGYIYFWLHSEYNFPNAIMSVVFGYFGKDLLEAIFEKLKSKIIPSQS